MDADPGAASTRLELTRRSMLKLTGAGVAGAGLWLADRRSGTLHDLRERIDEQRAVSLTDPTHTVEVHRRDDMLDLRFDLYGLDLDTSGSTPRLVRSGTPAYVVVGFPPQAIGEEALLEDAGGGPPPPEAPVGALLSDRTRVAFEIPGATTSIPYTLDALLGWTAWSLSVPGTALPPGAEPADPPAIAEPAGVETAIEAPWRLVLAPDPSLTFAHAPAPVTHDGRTELWHTRLAVRGEGGAPDEAADTNPTVRAVWSPDLETPETAADPFSPPFAPAGEMPVLRRHRREIVRQTVDYDVQGLQLPIEARRLMLSPLGAWTDLRGEWEPHLSDGLNVVELANRSTQGRDHFTKVVEYGFLFPFGHSAVRIAVTERKLQRPGPGGDRAAYLRKRVFIVVRDPLRTFPAVGQDHDGRAVPFTSVRLTTLITPPLDPFSAEGIPASVYVTADTGAHAQWPMVLGEHVQWGVDARDHEGRAVSWTMPMIWVLGSDAATNPSGRMDQLRSYYNALDPLDERRARDFGGQKVAFAAVGDGKAGSTAYDTAAMLFGAEPPGPSPSPEQPQFFPTMAQAEVHLAAAAALSGNSLSTTPITLDDDYVAADLDPAKGAVFAKLVSPVGLSFSNSSDRSGGLAAPNMSVQSLSRDFGTVGGNVDALKAGSFDPVEYFKDFFGANILGDITLGDVLEVVGFAPPDPTGAIDSRVPGLNTEIIYPGGDTTAVPDAIRTSFKWQPTLKADPLEIFVPAEGGSLTLGAEVLTPIGLGGDPTSDIFGELKGFALYLIGRGTAAEFLIVHFERIAFSSHNGASPDLDVRVGKVEFGGALKFVNPLEELLTALGVGPSIDLQPTGVTAGYQIPLPSLAIGVLAIQNMSLGASVTIPFTGDPVRVRFNFCTRDNPFMLSVTIFGGGGFFSIGVGATGIEQVEAALEFGGNFSFDIGIASGGIQLVAGIYFNYTALPTESLTLTGYVRLSGELSIAGGIVSIGLELYLALSYVNEGGKEKAVGEATLTISVSLFFFSLEASVGVRKEFGGGGDPTFRQSIAPADWNAYCDAFAAA